MLWWLLCVVKGSKGSELFLRVHLSDWNAHRVELSKPARLSMLHPNSRVYVVFFDTTILGYSWDTPILGIERETRKIFNDLNVFINVYLIINQFFLENLWKRDFGNLPKSLELPSFKTFRISWWQVRDLGANGNVMKKRYWVLKTMMEVRFQKKWSAISKF